MKRKIKYTCDMPRLLYTYFISYSDGAGAPSFHKFARSIGATLEDVIGFRRHPEFERAYRECNEIRRDYLIDAALTRRYDSSFLSVSSKKRLTPKTTALPLNLQVTLLNAC